MKQLLLILAMSSLMLACSKEKIDEHPDYIGNWIGDDLLGRSYIINIESDGSAYYYRQGIGYVERTGSFAIIKDGTVAKIAGKKMDINQAPTEYASGEWEMLLDDIYLYCSK